MAAAKDFGKNNWKVFNASTYLPRWAKNIVNAISVFKTPIFYDSFIRLGRFRTLFLFFKRFYIFQQIKVKKFYLYILSDVQTHDVMSLLLNHLTKVSGLIFFFFLIFFFSFNPSQKCGRAYINIIKLYCKRRTNFFIQRFYEL